MILFSEFFVLYALYSAEYKYFLCVCFFFFFKNKKVKASLEIFQTLIGSVHTMQVSKNVS